MLLSFATESVQDYRVSMVLQLMGNLDASVSHYCLLSIYCLEPREIDKAGHDDFRTWLFAL